MFCPKCGSLMMPKKEGDKTISVCVSCGYKKEGDVKLKDDKKKKEEVPEIRITDESQELPITEVKCPKCGNDKAYWWMQQTRASDEAPTRFFKCTKCGNTWREYQ